MDCIYLEIFKDHNFEKEDEGEQRNEKTDRKRQKGGGGGSHSSWRD